VSTINPSAGASPAIIPDYADGKTGALSPHQRYLILAAAFLAWMFAGLELSMFVLVGRAAILDVLTAGGASTDPKVVGQWFTWYQGAIMLGAAAGGFAFGWLGDRSGRTRAMAWAVLCYSLATGASYLVGNLWIFLALRFVVGMGIGGVWPNAVSLVAEAWPNASRPFLAGLLGTAANFGFVLLGSMALVWLVTPQTWRWVPLVGAVPVLMGVWMLAMVPESPKWLASRRAREADAARPAGTPSTQTSGNPLAAIFRPPLLSRTLLGILLGAIPVIGTSANGNWLVFWSDHTAEEQAKKQVGAALAPGDTSATASPAPAKPGADPRKKAITQIQRSGGGIFGSLLGGWVASLVGRRLTYFLISLFAFATSTYIFGFMTPMDAHFGFFTFLLGFISVTYFGWLPLYLPELFPTAVRSTGTGVSFNSGRIIAAVVVLGASGLITLFHGDFARVGLWTGAVYAAGMLVILLAPSTGGKKLED
jgi:MFS family permease